MGTGSIDEIDRQMDRAVETARLRGDDDTMALRLAWIAGAQWGIKQMEGSMKRAFEGAVEELSRR